MKEEHKREVHHIVTTTRDPVQLALAIALALSLLVLIVELFGSLEFRSSALVADALHIFTDVFSISFSLVALRISVRPPTSTLTYGYHRLEVFASIANGISLFVITGIIGYSAYQRVLNPVQIDIPGTILVALIALALNLLSNTVLRRADLMQRRKKTSGATRVEGGIMERNKEEEPPLLVTEDLNVKSASTHLFGDALSSMAVIAGAVAVYFTHYFLFDPVIAVFIGCTVLRSAIVTTWGGFSIMLERSPVKNMVALESDLEKVNGISDVHDLHVWRICSHITVATVHACLNEEGRERQLETMGEIEAKLSKDYGVQHATIQLEEKCCVPRHEHP